MNNYDILLKGAVTATVAAVTKEWALETWKASLSPGEYLRHRGAIPRGLGEWDSDPWDGIHVVEKNSIYERLRRYLVTHGWVIKEEWSEPGNVCYERGSPAVGAETCTTVIVSSPEADKHGARLATAYNRIARHEGRTTEAVRADVECA